MFSYIRNYWRAIIYFRMSHSVLHGCSTLSLTAKNTEILPTSPASYALKYLDLQRICVEGIVTLLLTIFYHPSLPQILQHHSDITKLLRKVQNNISQNTFFIFLMKTTAYYGVFSIWKTDE